MPGFEPGSSRYEADIIPMCYRASVTNEKVNKINKRKKGVRKKQRNRLSTTIEETIKFKFYRDCKTVLFAKVKKVSKK